MIEKAKIESLIEKHRPHTLKTPDEVSTLGTGKNAKNSDLVLSFNPKTTNVDEHIDLINTLGDMVDQKEEAKKEMFIETKIQQNLSNT